MIEYNRICELAVAATVMGFREVQNGYIIWRRGTGDNVELLHIRTYEKGQGTGRELLKLMLLSLKENPPYATVFGFTRVSNESQGWYQAMGFDMSIVKGVYAEGSAIVFSQTYDRLCEIHLSAKE